LLRAERTILTPIAQVVHSQPLTMPRHPGRIVLIFAMAIANEALRFAMHRRQERPKLASTVSGCKTPFELAETQSAFVGSSTNDYQKKAEMFVHQAQNSAINLIFSQTDPTRTDQFVCPRNCFRPRAISLSPLVGSEKDSKDARLLEIAPSKIQVGVSLRS
jgi:hypothetical protein